MKKCDNKCDVDQELKKDVQQFYDGCREASWDFLGPSYYLADNVMLSFEIYLSKLIYFTNTNSTVLAPSSHALLETQRKSKKLETSGWVIIEGYNKVVLEMVKDFNEVVKKLSNIIGELTDPINDALNNVGCALSNFMTDFIKKGVDDCKKIVDYEPVFKQFQKLMNTVALIAEIVLNECELATREVSEAVTVLTFLVEYFVLATQGINSCGQTELLKTMKCSVPKKIELLSESFEYVLLQLTQAVESVVFPFTESIKALLTNLVNITMFLNTSLKDILGPFEGVTINVGAITKNLSKNSNSAVKETTKGKTNILKGVTRK